MSDGKARHARKGSAGRRSFLLYWSTGLTALLAVLLASFGFPGFLAHLSDLAFDRYQQLKPREGAGAPVVVVDIDEASLNQIGQWPWPRSSIADMVDRLGGYGAAAIVFDVLFPEPDRTSPVRAIEALERAGARVDLPQDEQQLDNDAVLARAFARNRVVAGVVISNETEAVLSKPKVSFAFGGNDPSTYLPSFRGGVDNLEILSQQAAGLGFLSFPPSLDGVVRSLPLVASADGRLYPALAIEALRVAQDAGAIVVQSTGSSGEIDTGRAAMTALRVGAFSVPTGPAGNFRLYYSGLPGMPLISAATLLKPETDPTYAGLIDGRIVLIGTSAVGLRDLVATPFHEAMPGVRVHAEIIDQIVSQTFLDRPDWIRGAEIAAALLFGLLVLAAGNQAGAFASSMIALLAVATWFAVSWAAFSQWRLLLDPLLPALAVATVFATAMPVRLLLTDRERRFIRQAFTQYLSPEMVGRLTDNPQALRLGGEIRELTILFSDIRGFTAISEKLEPEALTRLLNDVLTPATEILLASQATIDKYIGDAIMAFWNAPLDIADHSRKACLSALGIQEAVTRLNRDKGHDLRVGIGLHSGECCVGNLGSEQRFNYSAVGDSVNLASRVEGLTKQYGVPVLVTEATRSGAPDLAFIEVDRVRVAGRDAPVVIHALLGDAAVARSVDFEAFAASHGRFLTLYRATDTEAARAALSEAKEMAPRELELTYALYEERLTAMEHERPRPDWDGVFVARQK